MLIACIAETPTLEHSLTPPQQSPHIDPFSYFDLGPVTPLQGELSKGSLESTPTSIEVYCAEDINYETGQRVQNLFQRSHTSDWEQQASTEDNTHTVMFSIPLSNIRLDCPKNLKHPFEYRHQDRPALPCMKDSACTTSIITFSSSITVPLHNVPHRFLGYFRPMDLRAEPTYTARAFMFFPDNPWDEKSPTGLTKDLHSHANRYIIEPALESINNLEHRPPNKARSLLGHKEAYLFFRKLLKLDNRHLRGTPLPLMNFFIVVEVAAAGVLREYPTLQCAIQQYETMTVGFSDLGPSKVEVQKTVNVENSICKIGLPELDDRNWKIGKPIPIKVARSVFKACVSIEVLQEVKKM